MWRQADLLPLGDSPCPLQPEMSGFGGVHATSKAGDCVISMSRCTMSTAGLVSQLSRVTFHKQSAGLSENCTDHRCAGYFLSGHWITAWVLSFIWRQPLHLGDLIGTALAALWCVTYHRQHIRLNAVWVPQLLLCLFTRRQSSPSLMGTRCLQWPHQMLPLVCHCSALLNWYLWRSCQMPSSVVVCHLGCSSLFFTMAGSSVTLVEFLVSSPSMLFDIAIFMHARLGVSALVRILNSWCRCSHLRLSWYTFPNVIVTSLFAIASSELQMFATFTKIRSKSEHGCNPSRGCFVLARYAKVQTLHRLCDRKRNHECRGSFCLESPAVEHLDVRAWLLRSVFRRADLLQWLNQTYVHCWTAIQHEGYLQYIPWRAVLRSVASDCRL